MTETALLNDITLKPLWVREGGTVSFNEHGDVLGVLQGISSDELLNKWIKQDLITKTRKGYKFSYVGIIRHGNKLLYCLPKYCDSILSKHTTAGEEDMKIAMEHFSIVLKVIQKYKSSANGEIYGTDEETGDALLSLMVTLLTDYAENGIYRDDRQCDVINGKGRIQWDKSINSQVPFIQQGEPVYVTLIHRQTENDDTNYFTRLHRFILKECCSKMSACGLLKLLGLQEAEDTEDTLDDFGDREYIEYRLEAELRQQFDSQKRFILQRMQDYVNLPHEDDSETTLYAFGTTSFEHVWEEVCRATLGQDCHEQEKWKEPFDKTKPLWKLDGTGHSGDPHRLDMLFWNEEAKRLELYDAKYYVPDVESYSGLPGIGDISKQHLYLLTLAWHCKEVDSVHNALLLPAPQGNDSELWGTVSMAALKDLSLGDIDVYRLKPDELYDAYLKGGRALLPNTKPVTLVKIETVRGKFDPPSSNG